ncbi:MAG: hypothetical protein D6725_13720, partial [Planctomycetota bacterium]
PLAFIDLQTAVVAGDWSVEDDRLRVLPGDHARLMLPGDVPRYYLQEVTVQTQAPSAGAEAPAETGSAIAFIVPVHGRAATILLDEKTADGYRCRIAVAPDATDESWQTPPYDQPLFAPKAARTVRILVQQQRLLVRVDDQIIFDVPADGPFTVPAEWQVREPEMITIGAHRVGVAFSRITRIPVKPATAAP